MENISTKNHKIPQFSVILQKNGKDISQELRGRLLSLTLEDNRGLEADSVTLNLDDSDGKLAFPKRGEKVQVLLGWQGEPLTDKGVFVIDEISYNGSPDVLTLRGKSADLMAEFGSGKERSFHGKTLGEIVGSIATECGLTAVVGEKLQGETVEHVDQNAESTANFLTRLAREYDAIATVKAGKLLFIQAGDAKSATGKALPDVVISRDVGDSFSFTLAENQNFDRVEAYYHDLATGKRGRVEAVKQGKGGDGVASDSTKVKTLRHTYKSKQAADNACKRIMASVERGAASFSITLAQGNAGIFPEIPLSVRGFKAEIDGTAWVVTKVSHTLDSGGFKTALSLEIKLND